MNTLIIAVVVFSVVIKLSNQQEMLSPKQQAAVQECAKGNNVDLAQLGGIKDGNIPNDKNFKCFLRCLFLKAGDMTEAGDFLVDAIKAGPVPPQINQDQFAPLVDSCTKQKLTDPCDTAFEAFKCMVDGFIKATQG